MNSSANMDLRNLAKANCWGSLFFLQINLEAIQINLEAIHSDK
jgi:hypothetical protein